jgi:hypothetical protein
LTAAANEFVCNFATVAIQEDAAPRNRPPPPPKKNRRRECVFGEVNLALDGHNEVSPRSAGSGGEPSRVEPLESWRGCNGDNLKCK